MSNCCMGVKLSSVPLARPLVPFVLLLSTSTKAWSVVYFLFDYHIPSMLPVRCLLRDGDMSVLWK